MIRRKIFLSIILIGLFAITSCSSSRKLYVVTIEDQSQSIQPNWLDNRCPDDFLGVGEARAKDEAYRLAIDHIKRLIAEEIGLEIELISSSKKIESGKSYTDTSFTEISILTDALLFNVNSKITSSYWEHCRIQTGKKSYNDFFRYYIRATVPQNFIDSLRTLTNLENDIRLEGMNEHLSNARWLTRNQRPVEPISALQSYIQALSIARNLFYRREMNSRVCLNDIYELLNLLKLELIDNYSEVRPERHHLDFKVTYGGVRAVGVKVDFRLERGRGKIVSSAISDNNGMVRCDATGIETVLADNAVLAGITMKELSTQLAHIDYPLLRELKFDIDQLVKSKKLSVQFSTMAKRARVRAGSLEIYNVGHYRIWFFRRISRLNFRFFLEELNGRSVIFDRYAIRLRGWHKKGLFSRKLLEDESTGEYRFDDYLNLGYKENQEFVVHSPEPIINLMNEMKGAHDWTLKLLQLEMTIKGKDDAGNEISVVTMTDRFPWKTFFSK